MSSGGACILCAFTQSPSLWGFGQRPLDYLTCRALINMSLKEVPQGVSLNSFATRRERLPLRANTQPQRILHVISTPTPQGPYDKLQKTRRCFLLHFSDRTGLLGCSKTT